jgi:hypothetical protein
MAEKSPAIPLQKLESLSAPFPRGKAYAKLTIGRISRQGKRKASAWRMDGADG